MSNTSNLVLPFLAVGQAQKHVTVNETLRKLDAIVQLGVASATTPAEPASPADGAVYILPSGKTGTHWSAYANGALAYYRDGAWVEIGPREGWLAFVKDTDLLLVYTGSAWSQFPAGKIVSISATDKILGRVSSSAGAAEEVTFTDQAQALCDDTSFGAMRTTLDAAGLSAGNIFTAAQTVHTAGALVQLWDSVSNSKWNTVNNNGALLFSKEGVADVLNLKAASVEPAGDNAISSGAASMRWSVVYSATGAINTSDAREKTALRTFSDAEKRAIRRLMSSIGVFQWLSSITSKGADPSAGGAREHVGVTAQAVSQAFEAEGLDPARYGFFCADELVESYEVEPARLIPARPASLASADAPAEEAAPERRVPAVIGERTVRDEKGEPVMRLGVRYDQIFAMALAVLFAGEG